MASDNVSSAMDQNESPNSTTQSSPSGPGPREDTGMAAEADPRRAVVACPGPAASPVPALAGNREGGAGAGRLVIVAVRSCGPSPAGAAGRSPPPSGSVGAAAGAVVWVPALVPPAAGVGVVGPPVVGGASAGLSGGGRRRMVAVRSPLPAGGAASPATGATPPGTAVVSSDGGATPSCRVVVGGRAGGEGAGVLGGAPAVGAVGRWRMVAVRAPVAMRPAPSGAAVVPSDRGLERSN